ncbi:MAG: hypothetical protein ACQESG_04035 [Nanobdellota archaeon]
MFSPKTLQQHEALEEQVLRLGPLARKCDSAALQEQFADKYGIPDIQDCYRAYIVPHSEYLELIGEDELVYPNLIPGGTYHQTRNGGFGLIANNDQLETTIEHEGIHAHFFNRQTAYRFFCEPSWYEAIAVVATEEDFDEEEWANFYVNKLAQIVSSKTQIGNKGSYLSTVLSCYCNLAQKPLNKSYQVSLDLAKKIKAKEGVEGLLELSLNHKQLKLMWWYG